MKQKESGKERRTIYIFIACMFLQMTFFASIYNIPVSLQSWMKTQHSISILTLVNHMTPRDGKPGSIFASPSKEHPNYYYHWVRDAAITINTFLDLPDKLGIPPTHSFVWNYVHFSLLNQATPNKSGGLGEPKFNVDGTAVKCMINPV